MTPTLACSPVVLSDVFFKLCELPSAVRYDLILAFLPQDLEMDRLAAPVHSTRPDDRIAVFDPLLLPHNDEKNNQQNAFANPSARLYRRAIIAWLSVLSENRRFSSHTQWILAHSILVREITSDIISTEPQNEAGRPDLQALNAVSDRVAVHLCSQSMSDIADEWQMAAIARLKRPQDAHGNLTLPERTLVTLCQKVLDSDAETYASRTLTACLAMFLHQSGPSLKEKEAWLDLAKHWQGEGKIAKEVEGALRPDMPSFLQMSESPYPLSPLYEMPCPSHLACSDIRERLRLL